MALERVGLVRVVSHLTPVGVPTLLILFPHRFRFQSVLMQSSL